MLNNETYIHKEIIKEMFDNYVLLNKKNDIRFKLSSSLCEHIIYYLRGNNKDDVIKTKNLNILEKDCIARVVVKNNGSTYNYIIDASDPENFVIYRTTNKQRYSLKPYSRKISSETFLGYLNRFKYHAIYLDELSSFFLN